MGGSKDGGPDPTWEAVILRGEGVVHCKDRDSLPCAVQKRLSRSRCRLGYSCGCKITFL